MSRYGSRVVTPHFVILWRRSSARHSRLGITVTKRVAGAVGRNRVKRMVREAFRNSYRWSRAGLDVVVIAKNGAPRLGAAEVARQMATALRRIQGAGEP